MHAFTCLKENCGGIVEPIAKEGRMFPHPEFGFCFISLPRDMPIHRCNVCQTDWLTKETEKKVHAFLVDSFKEHEELISKIVNKYRAKVAHK